ncbi:MAG TPA: polysaccharide deacetylase family protein [Thermomicrobiales bacterium]|nr:polysaccharide deacetylase family protein [Thermomicrobiales bacterium]
MPGRVRSFVAAMAVVVVAVIGPIFGDATRLTPPSAAAQSAPYFTQGTPGCMQVALIFNVGAGSTPATSVFDTLGAYGVPATFFVMGWLADQNPYLVQQMSWYGPVGSHGDVPPELTTRGDDDVAWDIGASTTAITNALGYAPSPIFTGFGGATDERVRWIAANQGYTTIGWGVESGDWTWDATADSVYANVMNNVYDGAIVELHMDSPTSTWSTATALPWIISDLQTRGYTLVSVPTMMGGC